MKPKDALIRDGFPGIKAGKGRLSLPAIARVKELAAQGWDIDGYTVTKPALSAPKDTPVTVTKSTVSADKVIGELYYRYSEADYRLVEKESGKVRSMRDACMNCGVSILGHVCDAPQVVATNGRGWVDVQVVSK